jgi:hypothetical protein
MDRGTRSAILKVARLLDSAEEAQSQAQYMMLPRTRLQMLKLAEIYRHMAEIALQYPMTSDKDRLDLSD